MTNADMPIIPTWKSAGDMSKSEGGLTKREYFAAMAMQGLMAGKDGDSQLHDSAPEWVADVTEAAVEFADALLAELDKEAGMSAMAAAQQAWDNAQPPDTSRQEREHELACKAALARYLKTGDLPNGKTGSDVWDELEYDEAGGIVLFDMLAAYLDNDDTKLLALARFVAGQVDNIVNEKIEEGLQWPSNT